MGKWPPECDAEIPVLCMDEQPVQMVVEFHYTPKHGSWLNIAENELSSMTRQCVANRRIGDIETLQNETAAWAHDVSVQQRTVDWQMRLDDARCKIKSVYPKIQPLQP